jgi:hypothetical protein
VEPHSTKEFPISLICKISKPISGKIIFANCKDEGTQSAAVLVFDLVSHVTGRIPRDCFYDETYLYDLKDIKIPIKNTFKKNATFNVQIISTCDYQEKHSRSGKSKKTTGKKGKKRDIAKEAERAMQQELEKKYQI